MDVKSTSKFTLLLLIFLLCACIPKNKQTTTIPSTVTNANITTIATTTELPIKQIETQPATPSNSNILVSASPVPFTPTIKPTYPTVTSSPTITPTNDYPAGINPLTYLQVEDPTLLEKRPILVKISNFDRTIRPQSGLSYADIVFEYYIGEGMNRFLALYYGQYAPKAGPIRSARLVDAQLTDMYQGVLSYGNADYRVESRLVSILGHRALATKDTPCPPVCGKDTHSTEGVFANVEELSEYVDYSDDIDNAISRLYGMKFSEEIPEIFAPANRVGVQFSRFCRGEWYFDQESGKYKRWVEKDDYLTMTPHIDRITDQQLAFSNVIILFADYTIYTMTLHDIEIWRNRTGQRAAIFRDGIMIDGYWKTISDTQPIQFFDENGELIPLKPGNTWIIFVSPISKLEKTSVSDYWELDFDLP